MLSPYLQQRIAALVGGQPIPAEEMPPDPSVHHALESRLRNLIASESEPDSSDVMPADPGAGEWGNGGMGESETLSNSLPLSHSPALPLSHSPSPRIAPPPEPERHQGNFGLKDRIMHFLKGAGLGFMTGGLGGAIGGGVGSAINKDFYHNMKFHLATLPNWKQYHGAQDEFATRNLARRQTEAGITGIDPETGKPSLQGRRIEEQLASADERIRQGDERIRQSDEREKRLRTESEIGNMLAAARLPGRTFTPESRARLEQLVGVRLPENFNPQQHDIVQDTDGRYYVVSIDKSTGQSSTGVVSNPQGGQLQGALPAFSQMPQFVYEGQAREEMLREMGVSDPNAMVDNPAFKAAFDQEKAAADSAAKTLGLPAPSDAEIARRVETKRKVPARIKASELLTPESVKQRMAQIHSRNSGGVPGGRAPRSGGPTSFTPARNTITRAEYDQKVAEFGQARVDEWLKKNGVAVQ